LENPLLSEKANKLISSIKIFDEISSTLIVESYGIGILRTKWDFTKIKVNSEQASDLAFYLINDIDSNFFTKFFLPSIVRSLSLVPKDSFGFEYLKESLTEIIFISTDNVEKYMQEMGSENFYQQIAQMLWL
jgi:hypothetical protein